MMAEALSLVGIMARHTHGKFHCAIPHLWTQLDDLSYVINELLNWVPSFVLVDVSSVQTIAVSLRSMSPQYPCTIHSADALVGKYQSTSWFSEGVSLAHLHMVARVSWLVGLVSNLHMVAQALLLVGSMVRPTPMENFHCAIPQSWHQHNGLSYVIKE